MAARQLALMCALAGAEACATSAHTMASHASSARTTGDLPAALASVHSRDRGAGDEHSGNTGTPARVALGGQRDAVRDLWIRYVRALQDRSLAELRPLFVDVVSGVRGSFAPVTRDRLMDAYDRLLQTLDPTSHALARLLEPDQVEIRAVVDFSRSNLPQPMARPGDWQIASALPIQSSAGFPVPYRDVPSTLIVRWVDGAPRVVAVDDFLLRWR